MTKWWCVNGPILILNFIIVILRHFNTVFSYQSAVFILEVNLSLSLSSLFISVCVYRTLVVCIAWYLLCSAFARCHFPLAPYKYSARPNIRIIFYTKIQTHLSTYNTRMDVFVCFGHVLHAFVCGHVARTHSIYCNVLLCYFKICARMYPHNISRKATVQHTKWWNTEYK